MRKRRKTEMTRIRHCCPEWWSWHSTSCKWPDLICNVCMLLSRMGCLQDFQVLAVHFLIQCSYKLPTQSIFCLISDSCDTINIFWDNGAKICKLLWVRRAHYLKSKAPWKNRNKFLSFLRYEFDTSRNINNVIPESHCPNSVLFCHLR